MEEQEAMEEELMEIVEEVIMEQEILKEVVMEQDVLEEMITK